MIIAKVEEQQTKQSNKQGQARAKKIVLSCNHILFHSQLYIHHASMLWPSKQCTTTRHDSSGYI